MSNRRGPLAKVRTTLGHRIAPPRFVMFALLLLWVMAVACVNGASWSAALVRGFDAAALAFIVSLWPLSRDHTAAQMRHHAAENDANRSLVLAITAIALLAILAAIAADLGPARHGEAWAIIKLIFTLALAWGFTNLVFALHYAHAHYFPAADGTGDKGGFEFPGTPEPDYWDFVYFSFTAGMSFAASDVNVTRGSVRRVLVLHSLLSFIFSIGVIAFTINTLSGGS